MAWIVLIPNHSSRLGWILQTAGPLIIAAAIIMFTESLVKRVGPIVVFFAAVGAICAGLSTLFFAIDPTNLALEGHVRFGYGGYAVGALFGAIALALVLVRKEHELSAAGPRAYPPCPIGCPCATIIHSSFVSIATGAAGLLIWGIGFTLHIVQPQGTSLGWVLSAIGVLLVGASFALHTDHLSQRFGRAATFLGIVSLLAWVVGYFLEAINPNASPLSSWYSELFASYAVGHLLSALAIVMIIRHSARLSK
ncbi:MAG: hypothetical protein WCJ88_12610 [Actinomycetes bacterium]